jgi:hypothetical protein
MAEGTEIQCGSVQEAILQVQLRDVEDRGLRDSEAHRHIEEALENAETKNATTA